VAFLKVLRKILGKKANSENVVGKILGKYLGNRDIASKLVKL